MIPLLRGLVFALAVLTVIYVAVSLYSASLRRERLEKQWEAEGRPGTRDDYVAAGMAIYRKSFRRRMLILIYILPLSGMAILVYLLNYA
ncbi:MAG: hypothetical protein ACK4TB_03730 [Gemmobacter sp.]